MSSSLIVGVLIVRLISVSGSGFLSSGGVSPFFQKDRRNLITLAICQCKALQRKVPEGFRIKPASLAYTVDPILVIDLESPQVQITAFE